MNDVGFKVGSSGIGFGGLMSVVLVTLKLIGVITWSWWWVTCLLWLPVVFVIVIVCLWLLAVAIYTK